jgi:putative GTP pyrophosphokinase
LSDLPLDESALKRQYDTEFSNLKDLKDEACYILRKYLKTSGIKVHDIRARIKEFDSLLKKAQDKHIVNPLEEITDVVGIRVICLFLSDIAKITEIIRSQFVVR